MKVVYNSAHMIPLNAILKYRRNVQLFMLLYSSWHELFKSRVH